MGQVWEKDVLCETPGFLTSETVHSGALPCARDLWGRIQFEKEGQQFDLG